MNTPNAVDWGEMVAATAKVYRQAVDKAEAARLARDEMIRRALDEGWTQTAVAERAGLSQPAVRKISTQGSTSERQERIEQRIEQIIEQVRGNTDTDERQRLNEELVRLRESHARIARRLS